MSNYLGSSSEREALLEQYPAHLVEWLNEVMGIVERVESRGITANEAKVLLKQRFVAIAQEYLPECAERIAAYRARVAAQEADEARNRDAYHNLLQQRRDADAAYQRRAKEAADRANRAAKETEERESKAHREQFDAEQRAIQAEKDRNEAEQAEALERRLLAAVDGDAE
jgi:hypothetical protein